MKVFASMLAELSSYHAARMVTKRRITNRTMVRNIVGWTVALVYLSVALLIFFKFLDWVGSWDEHYRLLGRHFDVIRNLTTVALVLGSSLVALAGLVSLELWIADNVTGGDEMIWVIRGGCTVGRLYVSYKLHRRIDFISQIEIDSGDHVVDKVHGPAVVDLLQGLIKSKDWKYETPYAVTQRNEERTL
jgi:hypothetical protein